MCSSATRYIFTCHDVWINKTCDTRVAENLENYMSSPNGTTCHSLVRIIQNCHYWPTNFGENDEAITVASELCQIGQRVFCSKIWGNKCDVCVDTSRWQHSSRSPNVIYSLAPTVPGKSPLLKILSSMASRLPGLSSLRLLFMGYFKSLVYTNWFILTPKLSVSLKKNIRTPVANTNTDMLLKVERNFRFRLSKSIDQNEYHIQWIILKK